MNKQLALVEIRNRLEELHRIVLQLIIVELPMQRRGDEVVKMVLKHAGISMNRLIESRRGGLIFYKRIICYILHDYCSMTYQKIADTVYLTSHVTIQHHVTKMRWWMANPQYAPNDIVATTNIILSNLGYEKE